MKMYKKEYLTQSPMKLRVKRTLARNYFVSMELYNTIISMFSEADLPQWTDIFLTYVLKRNNSFGNNYYVLICDPIF